MSYRKLKRIENEIRKKKEEILKLRQEFNTIKMTLPTKYSCCYEGKHREQHTLKEHLDVVKRYEEEESRKIDLMERDQKNYDNGYNNGYWRANHKPIPIEDITKWESWD